ncbi:hypothetical protein GG344DRAFT_79035 [Lentinula edodes]|nr:hypothetical protein GG344DRAFT_79035 [Lentinula edodes]
MVAGNGGEHERGRWICGFVESLRFSWSLPQPLHPFHAICSSAATNFPNVANLVGDAFNATIYVPATPVVSAQSRWDAGCGDVSRMDHQVPGTVEEDHRIGEEMHRLHARRWNVNPPIPNTSAPNSPVPQVKVICGVPAKQVGISTGATPTPTPSTPTVTGFLRRGTGLSPSLVLEEEEEYKISQRGMYGASMSSMATMSTIGSMTSIGSMGTNITIPDMSLLNSGGATKPGSVKDVNNPSSGAASANVSALPFPSPSPNGHSGSSPVSTTSWR